MTYGRILVAAVALGACSFERATFGPAADPDAGGPALDADPSAPDAPPGTPDASLPDACVPADELCNGIDDDCDTMIDEGLSVGAPCDGADTDLCVEGLLGCDSAGAVVCSDMTGPTDESCNGLDDDCDGVPDDGFDLLIDEDNCGACGNECTNTFGTTTCAAGDCVPTCSTDAEDCNMDPDDGCELRNSNPACAPTVTSLGTVSGDTPLTAVSTSGFGEAFFLVTIAETDLDYFENLTARIELENPPGVDFDIHLRCLGCTGTFVDSTTAPAGETDSITVGKTDLSGLTDYQILVEVRLYDAYACGDWTLTVTGDDPTIDTSCD